MELANFKLPTIMLLLLCACSGKNEIRSTIQPDNIKIQTGDILLRCGYGLTSRMVLYADKGSGYSHVGIAVDSAGKLMVVHAVPGEPDFEGDEDRIKLEPIEKYYGNDRACGGQILRYKDSLVANQAAKYALDTYLRNVLFDHNYDDTDTTEMYCCELIEYAYKKAGVSIVGKGSHNFNLPGLNISHVILPSDFLKSANLRTITRF